MVETKLCGKCTNVLPVDDFAWKDKLKGRRSSYCKPCNRQYNRGHYLANIDIYKTKARAYEEVNGGRRCLMYNITPEKYDELVSKYDGLCWICRINEAKVVDHDHSCCPKNKSCGKCIRGILCNNCNTGIGLLQDSSDVVRNALEYLQSNNMSL